MKGKATMIGREEEREGKGREFRKGEREREKGRERQRGREGTRER